MEMLRKYINEETDKVNVYESKIIQISNDSNNNIIFIVDWLEGDPIKIVFEDTSDIMFDLKQNPVFKEWIGVLEIRGFSYKREKDLYIVQFNFDTVLLGIIRLKCTRFTFYVPSEPITSGGNDNMLL